MSEGVVHHTVQAEQASLGLKPWEALVEPSRVFAHPNDVLAAPHLSREEKRAVLASWASDAWAVESAPALRHCPGLVGRHVPLDAVLDALRSLDPEQGEASNRRRAKRALPPIRWLSPRLSAKRSGLN